MKTKNPYCSILKIKQLQLTGAKVALQEAYMSLLVQHDYSSISVKLLCLTAHVARSTFYAYYRATRDIVNEIEDSLVCQLVSLNTDIAEKNRNSKQVEQLCNDTIQFIMAHKTYLYQLLIARPDYRFYELWKDGIKYHLYDRIFGNQSNRNEGLILETIASAVV